MKKTISFIGALVIALFLFTSCDVVPIQKNTPETPEILNTPTTFLPSEAPPTQVVDKRPMLKVISEAFCRSGPGEKYQIIDQVGLYQYFGILGSNRQILGIDDEPTWFRITDEPTWLKIDPQDIIDPDPQMIGPNEVIDPEPPHSTRSIKCWVPAASVEVRGALSEVPVEEVPRMLMLEDAGCFSGPGGTYTRLGQLKADEMYEIIGIDDDIAWNAIDDDIAWNAIDDDIAWVLIDPTAIIDPTQSNSTRSTEVIPCSTYEQEVPRCWVAEGSFEVTGDMSSVPVVTVPRLRMTEESGCYSGPDETFPMLNTLNLGQSFGILAKNRGGAGIDDESNSTNIDDDIAWSEIEDDITWFKIDPNAIVDPEPPHSPVNQLSPQPDPPGSQVETHCWVPANRVEFAGSLSSLPIPLAPRAMVLGNVYCNKGPDSRFKAVSKLEMNQIFDLLGVNRGAIRINDEPTWIKVDDQSTWFQIDSSLILDPLSPFTRINEIVDPEPPMLESETRCWIPSIMVQTCGNLSLLPVLKAPALALPTLLPTSTQTPRPVKEPRCSDFKTQTECNNHANDMQCYWESNKNVCVKH